MKTPKRKRGYANNWNVETVWPSEILCKHGFFGPWENDKFNQAWAVSHCERQVQYIWFICLDKCNHCQLILAKRFPCLLLWSKCNSDQIQFLPNFFFPPPVHVSPASHENSFQKVNLQTEWQKVALHYHTSAGKKRLMLSVKAEIGLKCRQGGRQILK